MSKLLPRSTSSTVRCERDSLLTWLGEVLAASDVHIVVEEVADAHSSVQITLRGDVPRPLAGLPLPLAGLPLRRLA